MASTLQLQAIALAVLLSALTLAIPTTSAQRQPPPVGVARPGCRDRCGNITIPYPFGIGAGCYRHDVLGGFQLHCDDTRSPPRLTISDYSSIQLAGLSLAAGEARAYLNATRKCYNATGGFVDRNTNPSDMVLGTSPYLFSPVKNRLVATGCPSLGYFVDGREYFVSGCTSVCRPPQYAIPGQGSCTGVGCCQSDIPPGVDYFQPNTLSLQQAQLDPAFTTNVVVTRCHYVFLVETAWFRYSDRAFLNRTDDFAVPVVLDWAVRNVGNCSAARRNATDYACRGANSECFDNIGNGAGYRCNCSKGFEGNPYLDGGCTGTHPISTALLKFPSAYPIACLSSYPLMKSNRICKRKTSTSAAAKTDIHATETAQTRQEATFAFALREPTATPTGRMAAGPRTSSR